MDFGKILMQCVLLDHFLCDRVQGVERFATHAVTSPSQVPPPPGHHKEMSEISALNWHTSKSGKRGAFTKAKFWRKTSRTDVFK